MHSDKNQSQNTQRAGDWIQTFTGTRFYPFDPRPEDIQLADIAVSLAHQNRWTGHTRRHYSVLEHSLRVYAVVDDAGGSPTAKASALFHDASEAYLCDIPRPLKRMVDMAPYRHAEYRISNAIYAKYGLPMDPAPLVHAADKAMLWWEYKALLPVDLPELSTHLEAAGKEFPSGEFGPKDCFDGVIFETHSLCIAWLSTISELLPSFAKECRQAQIQIGAQLLMKK